MDYKQMVLDYLEGRMEYHDFQNEIFFAEIYYSG